MRQSSGFAWKIQATAPSAISRRLMMREHGEITPESVAAWRDEMAARRLERATIRQRIAAVRAFAAWAARTGALPAELGVALSAVESPRRAGQHAPLALHEPQLRLMDRAAGAAWTDDPYKHGHLAERTHDY